jgi:hypothetical protein
MDLRNSLEHARNSVVTVNGHDYKIDAQGVAHGVADLDAKKLLANAAGAWKVAPRREAVQVAPPHTASETPVASSVTAPAAPIVDAGAQDAQQPGKRGRPRKAG